MLLLEVCSYHLPLEMQQLLLRRWSPTKACIGALEVSHKDVLQVRPTLNSIGQEVL
jgi:hypothetical protein